MSGQALVEYLTTRGRALILERYEPTSCIASTRIAIEVLRAHGIKAWPLAVEVEVHNRQAIRDVQTGATEPGLGSWICAVEGTGAFDGAENTWDGHLVAMFADARGEVLLDLSADQFARPAKGIHAEPLAIRVGSWPVGWLWPNGSSIAYRPVRSRSFRQSTNWAGDVWRETYGRIMAEVGATV